MTTASYIAILFGVAVCSFTLGVVLMGIIAGGSRLPHRWSDDELVARTVAKEARRDG